MNALARITFWQWYLFSVAFCYWLWNPFFSITQLMTSDTDIAVKAMAGVVTLIVLALYAAEGRRSLNAVSVALFVAFFACLFWLIAKAGIHSHDSFKYIGQWIVGLFLALALQGGRIYRSITSRVSVSGTNDSDSDDNHHHS